VRTFLLALVVLVAIMTLSILAGAGNLGWQRVLGEIGAQLTGGRSPLSQREAAIVWQLRAPRVLLAGLVGAALAGSERRSRACSATRSRIRTCWVPPPAQAWRRPP
jgi:iron complex transport system permease protein